MILLISFAFLWAMCECVNYEYPSPPLSELNVTRSTLAGLQAYRSALTLDWLASEDQRQRDLASAFVSQVPAPSSSISTECIGYPRPSSGKIARLLLELLKNLEGDDSMVVTEMIQALVRSKMLVETSTLEAEPDLESLVKTPGVMMGEPHITFPRILAMTWMTVADPVTTKKFGWCPLQKLNKYLATTKPMNIAKHMRALEPIIARARYIMEEFIQHVTPLNMYEKKPTPTPTEPGETSIAGQVSQETELPIEKSVNEAVPLPSASDLNHRRTFRRLMITTRVTRTTTATVAYGSPQVELSRSGTTLLLHVDSEPLSNLMSPEKTYKESKACVYGQKVPLFFVLVYLVV